MVTCNAEGLPKRSPYHQQLIGWISSLCGQAGPECHSYKLSTYTVWTLALPCLYYTSIHLQLQARPCASLHHRLLENQHEGGFPEVSSAGQAVHTVHNRSEIVFACNHTGLSLQCYQLFTNQSLRREDHQQPSHPRLIEEYDDLINI
jgi:hypothetical protein